MSLANKLATLRAHQRLTLEQLAERSGLPAALLQEIEAGTTTPALGQLASITRALGSRVGTLLDDAQVEGAVVTRADEQPPSLRAAGSTLADGMNFRSLARGKPARAMDPLLVDLLPEAEPRDSSHEGEEFLHVLTGRVELSLGSERYLLQPGDSIYFDSITRHRLQAIDAPARLIAVVYQPA